MSIITQILNFETQNLLTNEIIDNFKKNIVNLFNNTFTNSYSYTSCILNFQEFMNNQIIDMLKNIINTLDEQFKYSAERKKIYNINKSNVERTIVTPFGEIQFSRTFYKNKTNGEYYFYIDNVLNIESNKTYDPVVRAILVHQSVVTNPNSTCFNSSLNTLNLSNWLKNKVNMIPRQTIYRIKKEVKIRKIKYKEISVDKTLYVMVDEKWIHEQDKNNPNTKKWIMSKCFVTFTGIKRKGKRSKLIGKHTFITSSGSPWKDLVDEIHLIYDFTKIEIINLLSDAGSWILSGKDELRLYTNNTIIVNTCEFHVKQKISRSTTDKDLRIKIANIIYENEDKEEFIKEMDKLIEEKNTDARKQKVTEYKNYILNHWRGIINMKYSMCKSSMEAHIQHCIASSFSEVPKAYSRSTIQTNLKLQEMYLNGIDIIEYYLNTYNSDDDYVYNNVDKKMTK